MKSREERLEEYLRVSALLPQATEELMRYPGVRDVAVGVKQRAGKVVEGIAFRVYVDEKKAPAELPPGAAIPPEVLGVPTDVVLQGIPRHFDDFDDLDKYRPLLGGVQIGHETTSAKGTLGCIAQRNSDGSIVMLSNHHVMMDGGAVNGEQIGQPMIACCCCCRANVVGEVVDSRLDALVDCAIARITGQPGFMNEVIDIGPIYGSAPLNGAGTTVLPCDVVRKRGRTTGLTVGLVSAPNRNTDALPDDGIPAHTNQIEIVMASGTGIFSDHGDSGSVIVNEHNQVVALLWGGPVQVNPDGTVTGIDITWASRITDVMTALDITIINSGTAGTIPLGAGAVADEEAEPFAGIGADTAAPALETVRRALERTARGRAILALFDGHGHEINRLLNADRPVKAAWHRYQGPAFTAHVLKSARESEHRIPAEIEGVTPANLLIRMSVVLQERGSPALAAAVEENTLPLLELVARGDRVHALLAHAGELESDPSRSPYALAV